MGWLPEAAAALLEAAAALPPAAGVGSGRAGSEGGSACLRSADSRSTQVKAWHASHVLSTAGMKSIEERGRHVKHDKHDKHNKHDKAHERTWHAYHYIRLVPITHSYPRQIYSHAGQTKS